MKQLRSFLLLTSLSILFFACQKELSNETGNAGPTTSQWEFSENANFKGNTDTASIEASGGFQTLIVEGLTSDGKGEFFLQVFGSSITATSFKNPNVFFEYYESGKRRYSNVPTSADKFGVVITALSASSVSGTFSGEVEDSVGGLKQVVNGKFTAALPQNTAPIQGICKLQSIGFSDTATGASAGALNYIFNSSNVITRVQAGLEYNLTYTANRITIDTAQYFTLDANGRITSFNGYIDADPTGGVPRVKISYTYDGNGYMTKASYSPEAAPAVIVQEITFTWTAGNLAKVVSSLPGRKEKVEIDYAYDVSKTPKLNVCLFPNYEITFLQSAINYGKNSANLVTSSRITEYDASGVNTGTVSSTYGNYTEDADKYIKSFIVRGNGSVLPGNIKYTLAYRCF